MIIFGWLANLLIIVSWHYTGEKNRIAFVLLGLGEIYYIWLGADQGQWDLAFISLLCGLGCIKNWFKWGKGEGESR